MHDFRDQLEEDAAYRKEATVDRFVYLFEKTATQWERDEFKVAERCKKHSRIVVQLRSRSQLQHGQEPNPRSLYRRQQEQDNPEDRVSLGTFRSINPSGNHCHCPLRRMRQAEPQAGRLQVQRDPPRLQQNRRVDRMLQL